MKKNYMTPSMEEIEIVSRTVLLAGSGIESNEGDYDIDYGGVDEGGVIDPDAHVFDDDFDDPYSY